MVQLRLLVCGGGNGAHVLSGLAASHPDTESRVLTLYADEAERWSNTMGQGEFVVNVHNSDGTDSRVSAKPSVVSKDAAQVAPGCDIIVLTVPAFAHELYLKTLEPYIEPGMVIVGMPGRGGFDFAVRSVLGEKARHISIMSMESLPWACRIKSFGSCVDVLGVKSVLHGAVWRGKTDPKMEPTAMLQQCVGKLPELSTSGHLLGISMAVTSGCLHPTVMYGRWHDWDGQPVTEAPLFYQGLDEPTAAILHSISDEVIAVTKAIMSQRQRVDLTNVDSLYDWFQRCYVDDIADKSTLYSSIKTNSAYNGLTHPMKKTEDGKLVPDFKYRYLAEDIPCGLAVIKGIAQVAGISTPQLDRILLWGQEKLGKEYLLNGKMAGKDVGETRSPQRYGLKTLDEILGLVVWGK